MTRAVTLILAAALVAPAAIQWEEETEVSGGALQGMLGKLSKMPGAKGAADALKPKLRKITYDGSRMSTEEAGTVTVLDQTKRTLTTIDHSRKTWAVIGFDDMPVAPRKPKSGPPVGGVRPDRGKGVTLDEVNFEVTPTGGKQTQAGHACDEYRVTMGAKTSAGAGSIASEICAARVPGWEEVRAYQTKAAAGMPDLGAVPGAPAGMDRMSQEFAKIDGLPLITRVKVAGMDSVTRVIRIGRGGAIPGIPAGYQEVEHPMKALRRR